MLVLSRRVGEEILVGDHIRIMIVDNRRGNVRVGIKAPKEVPIRRPEMKAKLKKVANLR